MLVEEIIATVKKLTEEAGFKKRDGVMVNRRRLRFAEQAADVTGISEAAEYRTGLIDENVYHYQTAVRQATFIVRALAATEERKDEAEKAKAACVALWTGASRRMPDVDMAPLDRCVDHQAGDGIGWYRLKVSPDAHKLLGKKAPKDIMTDGWEGLPFIVEACDPLTIYYTRNRSIIAQVGEVRTLELFAKYPELRYNTGAGGYHFSTEPMPKSEADLLLETGNTATVYHVETATQVFDILINPKARGGDPRGHILHQRENIFGRPSFVPVPARVTGSSEPHKMFQPAVVNMYRIIQQMNVTGTLQQAAAMATGKPQYYLRRIGRAGDTPEDYYQDDDGNRKILSIGEGGAQLDVPPGYDLVPVQLAAGIDLLRAKQDLQGELFQVAFPLELRQPSEVRVTSGYDRSRIEEHTARQLGYLLRHQAEAWEELFSLMAGGLAKLGVPVRIRRTSGSLAVPGSPAWWIGERRTADEVLVKPADFQGVDLHAEMSSLSRAARVAMNEEGMRLAEQGFASDTEVLRDFRGVDNVEETKLAIAESFMERHVRETILELVQNNLRAELGLPPVGLELPGGGMGARPPAGATSPGAGATLVQPEAPGPIGEPALPGIAP